MHTKPYRRKACKLDARAAPADAIAMKRGFLLAVGFVVALAIAAMVERARTPEVRADYDGEPALVAASFVSDWCASCKVLAPRLAKVIPEFEGRPVKFVEFDFTFGANEALAAAAAAEGVGALFEQAKGATGFTLLVDRSTGALIGQITMHDDAPAMRERIARALAAAEAS